MIKKDSWNSLCSIQYPYNTHERDVYSLMTLIEVRVLGSIILFMHG